MRRRWGWYLAAGIAALGVGFTVPGEDGGEDAARVGVAEDAAPASVAEVAGFGEPSPDGEPVVAAAVADATLSADAGSAREPALEVLHGSASYYADLFEGRTTASGRPFRQAESVAAHRTLPFGTRLRVTNLSNGREVEVEVVDRGPFAHGRVLDLSKSAARELGFIREGHTRVRIEVLERRPID